MKPPLKILVTRTDRLGDVLMSLPALDTLRRALPAAEIDFLIRPELVELLSGFLRERSIRPLTFDDGEWRRPRGRRYVAALVLFDDASVLRRLWLRRIPYRVGAYSKLRSFLLLSHGVRQRRARAEKNEAQYGLDLTGRLLEILRGEPGAREAESALRLPLNLPAAEKAHARLRTLGLDARTSYAVVHPGMGGSAMNLSSNGYLKLIESLEQEKKIPVLLSRGPAAQDLVLVDEISKARPDFKILQGLSLAGLAEVFRGARWVLAPSTGPLHLAHYVGVPTIGVYPPVRSQSAARWRPYGGAGQSRILTPSHPCPAQRHCLGNSCPKYFCLDRIAHEGVPLAADPIFTEEKPCDTSF